MDQLWSILLGDIVEQAQCKDIYEARDLTAQFLKSLINTDVKCNTQPYCKDEFCEVCQIGSSVFRTYVGAQIAKLNDEIC